jgi:hypothetical protein
VRHGRRPRPGTGCFFTALLRGVLAHVDTDAAVLNVTNSYRMFQRPEENDPIVLRVYDVGADGGLLEPESLQLIAGLADRLALLMSHRMANLGATRRPELMPHPEPEPSAIQES